MLHRLLLRLQEPEGLAGVSAAVVCVPCTYHEDSSVPTRSISVPRPSEAPERILSVCLPRPSCGGQAGRGIISGEWEYRGFSFPSYFPLFLPYQQ